MRDFAANAEALIDAIGKNPAGLDSSDYKQYLKLNSDLAGEFTTLIGGWVDYGKTGEALARVAEKIGAPAPPLR
jgi:ketol-acid reductoisomerase